MSNHNLSRRSFVKAAALASAGLAFFREIPMRVQAQAKAPAVAWQLDGDYFETCNCDFLCPCISSGLTATPTKGHCDVAMLFHIDKGRYGDTILDGLNFIFIAHAPEAMGKGNWSAGIITDARATKAQEAALTDIASGKAGGPPSFIAPAIGKFLGAQSKTITYETKDMTRSVMVKDTLDQALEGIPGADPKMPMYFDNVRHPASSRLALAHATRTHLNFFDIKFDDISGKNNGHFAPFSWKAS